MYLYDTNKAELLKSGLSKSHQGRFYVDTVSTTWKISIEEVDKRDPLAGEILRLMVFLDGGNIQKELFEGGRYLPENCIASPLHIERALGSLQSYSLIRRLAENDVAIHQLVQQVMLNYMGAEASRYFQAVLKLVRNKFPWGGDLENLNRCLKYQLQVRSCMNYRVMLETHLLR